MKIWDKGEGDQFENSKNCFGEAYNVEGAALNIAVVTITNRYPEKGYLYNHVSHEMAYVLKGDGYIESSDGEKTQLSSGSVVHFAPNEKVAWYSSNMTLVMPCAPAFRAEQHFA